MVDIGFSAIRSLVRSLNGLPCWYVSVGGCTLPSFQLALGDKIPRDIILQNNAQSDEYRRFEGQVSLLVWCAWRLDDVGGPVTSSDDTAESICSNLRRLVQTTVRGVRLTNRTWDLRIRFDNGLKLQVFCDHLPGDPSFDGNWELWLKHQALFIGPGNRYRVMERK